jgi:phosphoglucosamine mutase
MLVGAYRAGLCSAGADVLEVGVLPTPAIAWLVKDLSADGGVMVSASHNPIADNGLKLFSGPGNKLADEDEAAIEAALGGRDTIVRPIAGEVGDVFVIADAADRYVAHLKRCLGGGFQGQRVALDCAHGAASVVGPRLFRELGAQVEVLHAAPDGTNINVACGATHLAVVREHVASSPGTVAGFAFDGDADRCLAVDEGGRSIDGDQIMLALAGDLKSRGLLANDVVVATVMSNLGFEKALDRLGVRLIRAAVGDRYVFEAMVVHDAALGGEQSGHIIQRQLGDMGDGILTAARLLQVMQSSGQPLSALAGRMEHFPQLLVNVKARNKAALAHDATIAQAIADIEARLQNRGRLLVRPSGTEPLVRVMAEGPDQDELDEVVHHLARVIEDRLG